MRGKLLLGRRTKKRGGITPADAGKTASIRMGCMCWQDHPRGCGENVFDGDASYRHLGSPPRMRGKRRVFEFGSMCDRITPADAGKT